MTLPMTDRIAAETGLEKTSVRAVSSLLAEGATVPFIARYRKEATGGLDETAIRAVRDWADKFKALDDRRAVVLKSLTDQGQLTDRLKATVEGAPTLAALEDIYLPYRPKRRTKATIARERGLEPLADGLWDQAEGYDPPAEAAKLVDPAQEVADAEAALAGARDILAERMAEDAEARRRLRTLYWQAGEIRSRLITGQEEAGAKFRDYFDWREPLKDAPSHRILAMRRGAKEGFLSLTIAPPEDLALGILDRLFLRGDNPASAQVELAVRDAYKRLLSPAMQTEMRLKSKKKADEEAIQVFVDNLAQLLLAPPLGQKRVLAVDPGLRTGCKVVCLTAQGDLAADTVIQPFRSAGEREAAGQTLRTLVEKHQIEAMAIGNGTASRETEAFVRGLGLPSSVIIAVVSESGASVYSVSEAGQREFPDYDATVRGAVSIGRRLMDPLSELVKIEPKAIGVGQYQHDVDQTALKNSLDDTVVSAVNRVGVEVNTASTELLTYVSGLGRQLADNLVALRQERGPFTNRRQLLDVPRLGPKAFEQAAGFLRIIGGDNPLDASAVHPESYPVVERMAADLGVDLGRLMADRELRGRIELDRYVTDKIGRPTLVDILAELDKPGRDPRQKFEAFAFAEGVEKPEDLEPGMKLPGIVTNVTNFGAFVDVGVHQDGLVHISQLADRFVKDPRAEVKVGQRVRVTVLEVDLRRRRISLSMKKKPSPPRRKDG